MTALVNTHPTLLDLIRRTDPDGRIAKLVEILNQTNRILDDMVWKEGNLPTGHKTTIRAGIPTPTWRKLYGGVQPTKSTSVQVTDTCGMLEAYAEVDKALADLNGNTAEFRLSEDLAHIEGMNIEFADTLIRGNETSEPEAFTGILPRFDSLTAANKEMLVAGGAANGQTDCTSMLLVVWGPNTVHGIYPKGSTVGLQMTDKGQVTVENATDYVGGAVGGGRFEAYRSHYRWDCGLTVRDWRYIARIHSIDVSTLTKTGGGTNDTDLTNKMAIAEELIPNLNAGRAVWYCNRAVKSFLRQQIENKVSQSTLTMEQVGGKPVLMFNGIPVHRVDALTATETSKN